MLTFINSLPPHDGDAARNALDMIMMAVSLDQPVQVIFQHDGVFQLINQQTHAIESKNPLVKYRILSDVFELEHLYVSATALAERQLEATQLAIEATPVSDSELYALLQNSSKVVRC
ncbi:sulfurtransferase complex subunit TusC [Aliidiomarina sedimenti]|uniref:Sulfurtransferase complex subunit TusC n=1 Tax=Aliidiomarina sedimenti TaxID=1933879 RepID=A0ABY0C194_9GAMM|nr:sulfurtransferase complex subunit TusC [Aliidiomarina sedimenti]RUO31548.1 sulfurtransferase complex subunit TusC [Aliidiomarina sedimenti]